MPIHALRTPSVGSWHRGCFCDPHRKDVPSMSELACRAGLIALLLATACTGCACPAKDHVQLFVDDTELAPSHLIPGQGGGGSLPQENVGNRASFEVYYNAPTGEHHVAFLYLGGAFGESMSVAQSIMEYRIYPPDDGQQHPPDTAVTY